MEKSLTLFVLVLTTTTIASAQKSGSQPLFTRPTYVCAGRGFVAMAPFSRPQSVKIVTVSSKGIEAPQTIPTTGNEVFGLQCIGFHLELRVREAGSDHFSVLPFRVLGGGIQPEPHEDINWSISRNEAMPSVVERRIEGFNVFPGVGMRGDWYVNVDYAPGHIYEIHFVKTFVKTARGGLTKLAVDLLSETNDFKIVKTVALIHFEQFEAAD